MTDTAVCRCGCGPLHVTDIDEAETSTCECGCGTATVELSRDEEIDRLQHLRRSVDERLEELEST